MAMSIISIRARGAVTLNEGGKVLSPLKPVYIRGETPIGSSLPPVAFAAGEPGALELKVEVPEAEAGAEYRLAGKRGGTALFSGSATATEAPRTLTFTVTPEDTLAAFTAVAEAMTWELSRDEAVIGSERVRMELYYLYGRPPRSQWQGASVEFLRDFAAFLRQRGPLAADPIADAVRWAFHRNPPRYDTCVGSTHFISATSWDDITLYWTRYLAAIDDPTAVCSCYDMASVVQFELRTLGFTGVEWAFMEPFGYLRLTGLVGRGQSNNPFYACPPTLKVIAETDPWRTAFGNHSFCLVELTQTIADACTGPHLGTQSPSAYVEAATDSIYPEPPEVRRGTVEDITYHTGVTHVVTLGRAMIVKEAFDPERLRLFKEAIAYEEPEEGIAAPPIARSWPSPLDCPVLRGWELAYEEIVPGYPDTVRHWRLRHGDEALEVNVYVTSELGRDARDRFLSLGSLNSRTESIFERGPRALGDISARYPDGSRYIWTYRGATFDVEARNSAVNLEAIAYWLQGHAEGPEVDSGPPSGISLGVSTARTREGELIELKAEGARGALLELEEVPEGLILVAAEKDAWVFLAEEAGGGEIRLVAVDPRTLLSTILSVQVEVETDRP